MVVKCSYNIFTKLLSRIDQARNKSKFLGKIKIYICLRINFAFGIIFLNIIKNGKR